MRFSKQETLPLICLLILCMLIPAENPLAGPDKQKVHAHWLFASHRKQGHKILPIQGGPRIQLQGPVVMENDPIPPRVLLGDSSGNLHLASKKGEAELPPDQFAIEDGSDSIPKLSGGFSPVTPMESRKVVGPWDRRKGNGVSDPGRNSHGNQTHRQAGHECDPMALRQNAKRTISNSGWMVSLQVGKIAWNLPSHTRTRCIMKSEIGKWTLSANRWRGIHELYLLNQPATAKEIATCQ